MNSIKLNGSNEIDVLRQSQRTDAPRDIEEQKPDGQVSPDKVVTDSVSLSDRATTINRLVEATGQLPAVRLDKVAKLQSEINAGTYNPPAATIADAILNSGSDGGSLK